MSSRISTKPLGLLEMLFKWSYKTYPDILVFHLGMLGELVTGALIELSSIFGGGWILSWIHGGFGAILIVGGLAILMRYLTSKPFRLASDPMIIIDTLFVAVISVSGTFMSLVNLGFMEPAQNPWPLIHVVSVYLWFVISLFGGGAARHAVGLLIWRISGKDSSNIELARNACMKCGECIKVCSKVTKKDYEETPVARIRDLLMNYELLFESPQSSDVKRIIDETIYGDCRWCKLCTRSCPIAWDKPEMLKELVESLRGLSVNLKIKP